MGRSAASSTSAARSIDAGSGFGRLTRARVASGSASASRAATSSENSRWVAPGFSYSATLNALRTSSGTISGSVTGAFHFVTEAEHVDDVDGLVALASEVLATGLAGDGDQGRLVQVRVGDAREEVGGPGPQRRQADTGVARQPAVDVGHERCALFVAHRNERHVGVPQREQQFLEFLAGEAEDVVDALDFETRREEVGGRHLTRPLDVVGDFRAGPTGSRGRRTP